MAGNIIRLGRKNYILVYSDGSYEILQPSGDRSIPKKGRTPRREYISTIGYVEDGFVEHRTYSAIAQGSATCRRRFLNEAIQMEQPMSMRIVKSAKKMVGK